MLNWQQFGLRKDPFDTLPLLEGGDLPISQAFVGREQERYRMNELFQAEERFCLAICGAVGVGKTSLANFEKVIWKYDRPKLLFSSRSEIEADRELLNKRSFLLEIIASVLREMQLLDPQLLQHDVPKTLQRLVDVTSSLSFSLGASAYGFGGSVGKGKSVTTPAQIPVATLEAHFHSLVAFVKATPIRGLNYSGLIVHVNNFDVVLDEVGGAKAVGQFFNEIRDVLQTPDVCFLFLGPEQFFRDCIAAHKRVKSIFCQTPLLLKPLSKTEVVQALEDRLRLLKSEDIVEIVKPFQNDVVHRLYDLYGGDIRSIMTALRDIVGQCSDRLSEPLVAEEALYLLGLERWHRIRESFSLTTEQLSVLQYIVRADELVTQKEVARLMNKAAPNVSHYYFGTLKDAGIIEEKRKEGRMKYWGLTQDYRPLKTFLAAKEKVQKRLKVKQTQMKLF